ncbi:sigma-70 family RNA polymerase sigma factor [Cohnella endophytica]|uniref:RNA polymerase sigma factor n=1 Tax=Cohnella endophytica TaxID=2419778 RepID=A0A494XR58_9BACL|nr:sigma-70 family RNA polymerase sigma factor [Cohnella endophytica]RKP53105.1 sigma-70 family RNA polymerase sigma factor [Cohnella endophytica]
MQANLLLLLGSGFHKLNQSLQEEIYREFYHYLYKPINFMINDHSSTEDIIQETFMIALGKCPVVENEEHMKAWIKVVAKNLTINQIRKSSKSRKDISFDLAWDGGKITHAVAASVEQEVEARSLEEQISRHLSGMKPEQRELIELKWKKGLSYKEIAHEIQDTEVAVKHKLHRARIFLKKKLHMDWGKRDE